MTELFELIMLVCFGISWPISVYKSLTSKSTQGKSLAFMLAIIMGYICGILSKISSKNINFVLVMYLINLIFVSLDVILYFVNRHRIKKQMHGFPTKAIKQISTN